METLHVNLSAGRDYDILIGKGLLSRCGEKIRAVFSGRRIGIITDSNVAPLYLEKVKASLEEAGFVVKAVVFPAGEASKNMDTLVSLYDGLLGGDFPLTRSDLIVTLGGGVTGDMGGFAAATLLRGIPFVQVPTTLLSQVDSSVGGKVAVDLKQGKNLAGVFYQPRLVLIDPDTLFTLPDRTFFDGMAEVVKYGMIGDKALFALLENCPGRRELTEKMEEIIHRSCDLKRQVVEEDECDTGRRMILNFGHTLGHAYEKLGHYETYMHGEAVSCGMVAITKISEKLGFTAPGTADRLEALLSRFSLPTVPDELPKEALKETLSYDKKGAGSDITAVFCPEVGKVLLHRCPKEEFSSWALSL